MKLSGLIDLVPLREFHEAGDDEGQEDVTEFEHDRLTVKAQLLQLHKQTSQLFNMIGENEDLDPWIHDHVGRAADAINVVHSHLSYENSNAKALGDGDVTPSDLRSGDRYRGGRDGADSSPGSSF